MTWRRESEIWPKNDTKSEKGKDTSRKKEREQNKRHIIMITKEHR